VAAPVRLGELLKAVRGIREDHRSALLRGVMAQPGSQTSLARRLGLSPGTVSAVVSDLEYQGLVRVEKTNARQTLVRLAPAAGAVVGVELGFHLASVVARRADQQHDEAVTRLVGIGAAVRDQAWIPAVADAVRDAVSELGEDEIAAIGLGVPRMVDPHSGMLVPPALPPWRKGDDPAGMLAAALRQRRETPRLTVPAVMLDNDANLAAYAESLYVHKDVETLVAIKASTGIGAGIVIAGRIFRGRHGVAGEIGHTVSDPRGRFCSCGGRGCLETLIGGDALVEQARTVLGHRRQESPDTLEALVDMASRGSQACQRVLREAGATLGFAIGNLCNILNPDVVVIGGTLGQEDAARFTLAPVSDAVKGSAMTAAADGAAFRIVGTGLRNAGAHGALLVAVEGTVYPYAAG
jgi:predicted NBD/HSP70 family sugar kinase